MHPQRGHRHVDQRQRANRRPGLSHRVPLRRRRTYPRRQESDDRDQDQGDDGKPAAHVRAADCPASAAVSSSSATRQHIQGARHNLTSYELTSMLLVMPAPTPPRRSALGLLVLGQLMEEPMHVYRMQKLFEATGK